MREPQFVKFLEVWHQTMIVLMFMAIVASVMIYIYNNLKFSSLKTNKEKWDYYKTHQVKYLWFSTIAFVVAVDFFLNTIDEISYGTEKLEVALSLWWFVIRFFISGAIATLLGYIIFLVLKL